MMNPEVETFVPVAIPALLPGSHQSSLHAGAVEFTPNIHPLDASAANVNAYAKNNDGLRKQTRHRRNRNKSKNNQQAYGHANTPYFGSDFAWQTDPYLMYFQQPQQAFGQGYATNAGTYQEYDNVIFYNNGKYGKKKQHKSKKRNLNQVYGYSGSGHLHMYGIPQYQTAPDSYANAMRQAQNWYDNRVASQPQTISTKLFDLPYGSQYLQLDPSELLKDTIGTSSLPTTTPAVQAESDMVERQHGHLLANHAFVKLVQTSTSTSLRAVAFELCKHAQSAMHSSIDPAPFTAYKISEMNVGFGLQAFTLRAMTEQELAEVFHETKKDMDY